MNVWLPLLTAFLGFAVALVADGLKERWARAQRAEERAEIRADRFGDLRRSAIIELQDASVAAFDDARELNSLSAVSASAQREGKPGVAAHLTPQWNEGFTKVGSEFARLAVLATRIPDPQLRSAVDTFRLACVAVGKIAGDNDAHLDRWNSVVSAHLALTVRTAEILDADVTPPAVAQPKARWRRWLR